MARGCITAVSSPKPDSPFPIQYEEQRRIGFEMNLRMITRAGEFTSTFDQLRAEIVRSQNRLAQERRRQIPDFRLHRIEVNKIQLSKQAPHQPLERLANPQSRLVRFLGNGNGFLRVRQMLQS